MRMTYKKREFARQLRQDQTNAEEKVWAMIRDRRCFGLKFRRQHVVEGFVLDFYCHEQKLGIELDGGIHSKRMVKEYDRYRQQEIESKSIKIIRINNEDVEKDKVLNKIKAALELSVFPPRPLGEGDQGGEGFRQPT